MVVLRSILNPPHPNISQAVQEQDPVLPQPQVFHRILANRAFPFTSHIYNLAEGQPNVNIVLKIYKVNRQVVSLEG